MKDDSDKSIMRQFLIMGCCSVLLHGIIAAIIILPGMGQVKPSNIYRVEVKYLQPETRQAEEAESEQLKADETRKEPEKPAVVDLTKTVAQVLPETMARPEEVAENLNIVEIPDPPMENIDIVVAPVAPVENAIITPDGGLGSGADTEAGGGNSLFASGTGSGWGGDASGDGWGGGRGSPGSGGGTGGGYGRGTGNSRGNAGAGSEKPVVYYAGMSGITPPGYERTPQPPYPAASKSRGEQGEILLKVEVLTSGRVGQAEVEKSSGYASLDEAALTTVRRWRFKPALKGRETVICWVNIPIRFRLN